MRFSVSVCCSIFTAVLEALTPQKTAPICLFLFSYVVYDEVWGSGVGRGPITPLALTPVLDAMLLDSSCM